MEQESRESNTGEGKRFVMSLKQGEPNYDLRYGCYIASEDYVFEVYQGGEKIAEPWAMYRFVSPGGFEEVCSQEVAIRCAAKSVGRKVGYDPAKDVVEISKERNGSITHFLVNNPDIRMIKKSLMIGSIEDKI